MLSYTKALNIANYLKKQLKFPHVKFTIHIVGSVRRKAPYSKDIDLLIVVPSEKDIPHVFTDMKIASRTYKIINSTNGIRKRKLTINHNGNTFLVDLFVATNEEKPFALFHFTGNKNYNIRIRAHAKRKKLLLNQYGIFKNNKKVNTKIKSEKDITKFLGTTFYKPEDRM